MQRIKIAIYLLLSFFVSFIVTTIMTDSLARGYGFYDQGLADSAAIERGEF